MFVDRDSDGESRAMAGGGCKLQFASMRLDNVVAQRKAQASALACWLGRKKGLEDFVFDGVGDAGAVVGNRYLCGVCPQTP